MNPIDFHIGKTIIWKSINCLVTDIPQNIFLCVQPRKEIPTGLKQLEGK